MIFATERGRVKKPALLLVLLSLPLFAQTPSGSWGERGISRRFAVSGNLVYAADGRGVSVYDVSNPAAIRRIDVESGDAETRDLALMGSTDLVVATSTGIDRFAVASDGTLTRLGTTLVEGGVDRVAASATRVAAAAGTTLLILERTEDALATNHQQTFGEAVRALAVSGSSVYAAVARTAIFRIDMNSGANVSTIGVNAVGLAISGSTLWAAADIRGLFAIDLASGSVVSTTGEGAYRLADVAAAGSRVYAFEAPDRLHVFDVSNRTAPKLEKSISEWVNVIAADGDRLFLSGAIIDSEKLSFETGTPLEIFDSSLQKRGEYRDLSGPVSGVWTDGSLAYVIDAPYLRILDISRTAMPRELGSIVIPDIQDFVRVRNGLAINYGRLWVHVLDVSSPRKPKLITSWHTQGHAPSDAAILRDTFVEANNHSGLHVVDYSDPSAPVQISGRIFHYLSTAAGDDAIYTILQTVFLTIDLTDRRRVVDRTMHSGQFFQIDTLPPNAAYPHHVVLRSAQGIALYSLLENRFEPKLVAFVPMSFPGLFGTSDTSVFVSKDGILHRLDGAAPFRLNPTDMAVTSPMQISVAGEKVVIADRYRLRVYGPDTPPVPAEPGRRRAVAH